jgi:hypothetical protein
VYGAIKSIAVSVCGHEKLRVFLQSKCIYKFLNILNFGMRVDEIEARAHKNSGPNTWYFKRYKNDTTLYTILSLHDHFIFVYFKIPSLWTSIFVCMCLPIASTHMP